ncbi:uncharacterized protein PFL1_02459 [Pseudozyma flocculosa PF-1]|uniref:Uncharacterized protein n=1 Tax=Pseudozyma flocculosa PF-1 TaxID=1277687 RepID=A0A061HGK0_9BASI|nr:uncharacterized protein PFL1_02459 [Pseudozyma flocculosa PF-1]EPQ29786.1 hypothetical protein PFL1_02459 [Pseudozyma flocculosa PF-1]
MRLSIALLTLAPWLVACDGFYINGQWTTGLVLQKKHTIPGIGTLSSETKGGKTYLCFNSIAPHWRTWTLQFTDTDGLFVLQKALDSVQMYGCVDGTDPTSDAGRALGILTRGHGKSPDCTLVLGTQTFNIPRLS